MHRLHPGPQQLHAPHIGLLQGADTASGVGLDGQQAIGVDAAFGEQLGVLGVVVLDLQIVRLVGSAGQALQPGALQDLAARGFDLL